MNMHNNGGNMNKKVILSLTLCIILTAILIIILYELNIIPHKSYSNSDFNIETYISKVDKDNDGIDDQTDIINNVKKYIETKPKYKSKYYASGYPDDEYGVCTDVVAFGLKGAGYDLMELVNEDIVNNKERYNIETIDKNIDFRRVRNLNIYFKNNSISLTTDLSQLEQWQGGDIIVFTNHIGIISDKRNKNGIPFLIHHANPMQVKYEEDVLEIYWKEEIIGHYRIS